MPTGTGGNGNDQQTPSAAWADFRAYLTGQRNTGADLPDHRLSILKAFRSLPSVVGSDLWARRNK